LSFVKRKKRSAGSLSPVDALEESDLRRAEVAPLDWKLIARRGSLRGLVLGVFLVAVVFALRPIDPDWDFNWRKLAWWSTGSYFYDLALPGGAAALFFLAGFFELPLAWVEERARREKASLGRDARAFAWAVMLLFVCGAALAFQSLYLGHTFDGEPSLRRPLRYLDSDLTLLQNNVGAIAARVVALFAAFVVGMVLRIRHLAKVDAMLVGAFACSVCALANYELMYWDLAARELPFMGRFEGGGGFDLTRPLAHERYLVLSVFMGALEPRLVRLADELDARLSRWLNSDDAA
jgi:hypothetical protein